MIIQRRAGMLDYRNSRITRLNASLTHGKHEAIELALTQLRKAPEEETVDSLEDEETLQQDLAEAELEFVVGSDLPIEEESPLSPADSTDTVPDLHQEQVAIRGLSALGAIRLPLYEVLGFFPPKFSGKPFTSGSISGMESLPSTQTVTTDDVQAAILSAYAGQMDNEFVVQAAAKFTQEVEQAVNFATRLAQYGWTGPHLRLHQADAARRMADILIKKGTQHFFSMLMTLEWGNLLHFLRQSRLQGFAASSYLLPKQWQMIHGLMPVVRFL